MWLLVKNNIFLYRFSLLLLLLFWYIGILFFYLYVGKKYSVFFIIRRNIINQLLELCLTYFYFEILLNLKHKKPQSIEAKRNVNNQFLVLNSIY